MTKIEIFTKIVNVTAEVCGVTSEDIMNSNCRKEDVVTARSLVVFWTIAAGFSIESLLMCTDNTSANSINSIKSRIEDYWCNRYAYHMLAREIGRRLLDYAHSIGEDFDMELPLRKIAKATEKY